MTAIRSQVARVWAPVRWYIREFMGDSAYERYLARFAADHPVGQFCEHRPLSEKEFWRQRVDNQPLDARCC